MNSVTTGHTASFKRYTAPSQFKFGQESLYKSKDEALLWAHTFAIRNPGEEFGVYENASRMQWVVASDQGTNDLGQVRANPAIVDLVVLKNEQAGIPRLGRFTLPVGSQHL